MTKTFTTDDLQKLLHPLGDTLDLVVLSALSSSASGEVTTEQAQAKENASKLLAEVFERTVGPYDEVLGNALRIATWDLHDYQNYVARQCAGDHPGDERYLHPKKRWIGAPPRPSLWVWLRLFGGDASVEQMKRRYISERKCEYDRTNERGLWCDEPELKLDQMAGIYNKIKTLKDGERWENGKVSLKVMAGVLVNALTFLRKHADGGASPEELIGVCAQYGLNGPITHIVGGRYGPYSGAWKINRVHEPLKISPLTGEREEGGAKKDDDEDERYSRFRREGQVKLAPYAIASILGHANVVRGIIKHLNGSVDAECNIITHKVFPVENVPSFLLTWAILSNQPAMVRCLVEEIGFQFRWLDDDDLYDIWKDLHDTSPYEHTRWMTFDLLFPEGADFARDKEFFSLPKQKRKEPSEEDIARYEKWEKSLTPSVKHARNLMFNACSNYNSVQPLEATEDDYYPEDEDDYGESTQQSKKMDELTLHAHEYYEKMVDTFENQGATQKARLSEYEARDPRWVSPEKYVRKEYREDEYDY